MRVKNRWAAQGIGDAHHCFARVTAYSEEIRARSPVLGSCEFAIHFAVESATLDIKVLISAVAPFGRMRDASKSLVCGHGNLRSWGAPIQGLMCQDEMGILATSERRLGLMLPITPFLANFRVADKPRVSLHGDVKV